MRKVAIIGAGISGLTLGYYLQKNGCEVTLFERSDRAGGCIQTIRQEGFLFERGPRTLRSAGIETLQLVEELGLHAQVIGSPALPRYLYLSQKMRKVPQNPLSFIFSPLTRGHLFTFLKEGWKRKAARDESIYDFAKRRYSAAVAETFFDPLVSGVFGGDMERLSMSACFPSIARMEEEYGSLLKALLFSKKQARPMSPFVKAMQKFPLFSFQNGLETLPLELAKRLNVHYGTCITDTTTLQDSFDHVYSTVPFDNALPRASLAAVHIGYNSAHLPYKGFGYLIPRSEKERVLGMVFDSAVFPSQNPGKLAVTAMIGGARMGDFETYSDEQFIDWALEGAQKHLGLKSSPDLVLCSRHPRAIPQYPVGYQRGIQSSGRLIFLGSSCSGVAVNDCVAAARELSKLIFSLH